jgi:periplasmic protein TonB
MRIRSRHMGLAIGVALAIHVAAAIAMVLEPEKKGAAATGMGGIQVSLGPSGGAPGSVAQVVSEVDKADPVEPAAAPVAKPETAPPDKAETQQPPPETARPNEPPPPAPADVAVETAEVVQQVDEVIAIAKPEKVETPPPPEPVKVERPEPPEKPVEAKPEPVEVARVEPAAPPVETPPMPVTRPEPPKPQKTQVEPTPAPRQTAALAVEAPTKAKAQPAPSQTQGAAGHSGVGQSPLSGSAESSSGGGRPGVSVDYASILQAWLEDHKEYPRRARSRRQEGVVMLYFVMDRSGHVLEYRIDRSSGYDLLDREVEQMIQRAQPLPPLPDEMTQARLELVVPVQFQLR